MGDFLRSIIKWILLVLLVVFVVWLVIHFATKNESKAKKKVKELVEKVEPITIEDPIPPVREETQVSVVEVGDTGTTEGITTWIGVILLASGATYIFKTGKCTE